MQYSHNKTGIGSVMVAWMQYSHNRRVIISVMDARMQYSHYRIVIYSRTAVTTKQYWIEHLKRASLVTGFFLVLLAFLVGTSS